MTILNNGERIDQLFSSDVKIIQNKAVFSYSIDSVLLSRFPRLPQKGLIVDLCAGNGAIGLFVSKQTKAKIIGIELQERLADMAKRSVTLNQLDEQMTIIQDDLSHLLNHVPRSGVDLILCNPPYFKKHTSSKKNISPYYLLARHEITTDLTRICHMAKQALKSNGRLALVHRPDRFFDILDSLRANGLAPKRLQFVYPKKDKAANMLLIEAIKDGYTDGFCVLPPLIIHQDNGEYTKTIADIYFGDKHD